MRCDAFVTSARLSSPQPIHARRLNHEDPARRPRRPCSRIALQGAVHPLDKLKKNGVFTLIKHLSARHSTLAAIAAAALAACGGGGGDSTPAATAGPLTVSGTAVKGAALGGATVDVKCAAGTGSGTAAADGTYTINIASATLPCLLRASGTDGSVFHAVVPGSGAPPTSTVAANITPLTEMIVAQLAGATPSSYFASFGGSASVPQSAVTGAIAYVKTAVAGITDLGTANPLTDALMVGNPLDQKIDALMATLTGGGLTLADVTAAIAANPSAPAVVAAPLAPTAADCTWLKSGRYRVISPYETDPRWRTHVLTIDAATSTATDQDGATSTFTSDGGCQYSNTDSEFTTKVLVSSSGVLVMHSQSLTNSALRTVSIGLPEQTLPLSEFAGTWNLAGWDPASGIPAPGYVAQTDEVTFDTNGAITAASECVGTAACVAGTGPFASFAVNGTQGGFNLVEGGVADGRVFMFKTLAGKAAWVLIADDGQFIVATRKESLGALPAVGSDSHFREFGLNGNGTVSTLAEQSITVTATDPAANTITRQRASDGRVDTLRVDYPRTGTRYRELNTCTNNVGAPLNCSRTVQIPLQGMGITLSLSVGLSDPATAFYFISVGRPAPLD